MTAGSLQTTGASRDHETTSWFGVKGVKCRGSKVFAVMIKEPFRFRFMGTFFSDQMAINVNIWAFYKEFTVNQNL